MIRKTDPEAIRPYLEDASGMKGGHAEGVVLPESIAEAAEVLAECTAARTPVTLSGGGTGLAGGRVPLGGIVLATDRLGGVTDISRRGEGGVARCGPAASLAELQRGAAAAGLFLPPDPTEELAWLGGAVATNASGSRSFHYGPIRGWVRRLTIVLADGTVLEAPRGRFRADSGGWLRLPARRGELRVPVLRDPMPAVKCATGYARGDGLDLVDLLIGSEGTLALVAAVELDLRRRPEAVLSGVVFFPSEEQCWAAVADLREASVRARGYPVPAGAAPVTRPGETHGLLARALEYFGADALAFARTGGAALPDRARAALLVEQEHREADREAVADLWMSALSPHGALLDDSWIALGDPQHREIRQFRHALPKGINDWLSRHGRSKHATDLAVPTMALGRMLRAFRRGVQEAGLASATFGHIGDSHLHVNLLPRDDREETKARDLLLDWARMAVAAGGVVSAEHGVGKLKAPLLEATAGPGLLAAIRATRAAMDPAGILGPGTLVGGGRAAAPPGPTASRGPRN